MAIFAGQLPEQIVEPKKVDQERYRDHNTDDQPQQG
jgi:hypothetical protein